MTDALDRAEAFSALAIIRGTCPAPTRNHTHAFIPFFRYVRQRWETAPLSDAPREDLHWNAEFAAIAAEAWALARFLAPTPLRRSPSRMKETRAKLDDLRARCVERVEEIEGGPFLTDLDDPVATAGQEALVVDYVRLAQITDVCLAETGDRAAMERLAADAERCNALRAPGFLRFANGARALLARWEEMGACPPGSPPLCLMQRALDLGAEILGTRQGAAPRPRPTHAKETEDDRAGLVLDEALELEPEPQPPGVVVFPAGTAMAAGKGENRREIERFLGKTLGARLPLVPVPADWNAWEATLNAESPWLAPFHRAIRLSQGGRSHWGGGVICVEGPPGAGKSRGVRRVAEVSGLPYARVNLEATSDNAGLGGTSIRYLSAHASVLEGLIATSGKASVCLALDEFEKAGGGRKGGTGDPHDLLHGWFEAETARAWRSNYLLSPIDVSHTLFLCTANEMVSVPGSLRDRMSVIRVGAPLPEHVGVLAPALAREACRELGQDERFGLLDADEMSVLANAWSQGGSIRRLARLVRAILDAREAGLAAMPRH